MTGGGILERRLSGGRTWCTLRERHVMVLLCAWCSMLNYADRVNLSVAIISIGEDYSYSVSQQGSILSAFFWGYIPSQLLAALLCRRHGAKLVLAVGAFCWSLFTALTPLAARYGLSALLLCRVGMGLSEGVAFPSVYHFFGGWIPPKERGKAMAVFHTGVHIGTTVALVLSPKIIKWHSWQMIFYLFGGAGGVWIIAWLALAHDKSDPHDEGRASSPAPATTRGNTWLQPSERRALVYIFRSRTCMTICVTQFLMNFFHYTVLSWLPTYFRNVFAIETTALWFTFIPYLTMTCTAFFGGVLADTLATRTNSLIFARKAVTGVACGGAGAMILAFAGARTVPSALVCISASLAFLSLNCGGFEASFLDVAEPSYAGLLKSVANTLGACSGALAVAVAAKLLDWSGSWRFVFATQATWCISAALLFWRFASGECVLTESEFAEPAKRTWTTVGQEMGVKDKG